MPRLLTRGDVPWPISATGWPASSRNGGRHQIGTLAGFASEWVAGFRRNPQHTAEEIVAKLRQVDVLVSQGRKVAEAIRSIEVTEVTYYRWRSEYGGLKGDQVKRLKSLETENQRLRRAISDLTLEKLILKEAASGNF